METGASSTGLKTIQLNDQKAGMKGLDKEHINKIIYEASKGTPYFAFQEKRQMSIDHKVKELKSALHKITKAERNTSLKRMDALCALLEGERDLSHSIVHIDMDAFYAAVEMEDNPSLKGKPVAVGSLSMLSTSNYEARKYGVRAAMPGFIAKKLCPQLTIVPCHFTRYKEISNAVQAIVRDYDPDYCPASLDEMYFDLTKFIQDKHKKQMHEEVCLKQEHAAEDLCYKSCFGCSSEVSRESRDEMAYSLVAEIREKIYAVTNLTASAGIAPNVMLAKVCSDQNKPNGQYQIESTLEAVHAFTSSMPVKKVSGIGPVTGQILNALEIFTCQDMWEKRDIIPLLFKDSSSDFYMRVALGISSTVVKSEHVRKSIGTEQTFREIHDPKDLHQKCRELCEEVVEDLRHRSRMGKVVVLKFKTTQFDSHTRNHTLPCHSADVEVIHSAAKRLLDQEIVSVAPKPLSLRLMGIRIVNLIYEDSSNEKQIKIKDFLKPVSISEDVASVHSLERASEENEQNETSNKDVGETYVCPVCQSNQMKTLIELNTHIDNCLNKVAIKEILSEDLVQKKRKQPWEEKQNPKKKIFHKNEKRIEDYFC